MSDLEQIIFRNPGAGWNPNTGPRQLHPADPDGCWRDALNFRFHDGEAAKRAALVATTGVMPTLTNEGSPDPVYDREIPLFIINGVYDGSNTVGFGEHVLITDRDIWRSVGNTWVSLVPTYEVGTIDIANGTATVNVNTGTPLWLTRQITVGSLIELPVASGNWYPISVVNGDTQLTISTNFTGTTITNGAYVIRRRFPLPDISWSPTRSMVFAEEINGDLYVAGKVGGNIAGNAVIRVTDIWEAVPTAGKYITGTVDLTGTLDFITTSFGSEMVGLVLLDDGRVTFGLIDFEGRVSRIYYSSHLNQFVWTTSPGGFTDVVSVPGILRAYKRLGNAAVLHYDMGVAWGQPTGQDDPPLTFRPSHANRGCGFRGTLINLPQGDQGFLGRDGIVYLYQGSYSRPLSMRLRNDIKEKKLADLLAHAYSSWDSYRQEWSIWVPSSDRKNSTRYAIDIPSGRTRKETFPVFVSACESDYTGDPAVIEFADGRRNADGVALVGIPSTDPLGTVTEDILLKLDENGEFDVVTGYSGSPDAAVTFTLETGDLDRSHAGAESPSKTELLRVDHVVLRGRGLKASQTPVVSVDVSYDGGLTWDADPETLIMENGAEKTFFFRDFGSGSGDKLRIRLTHTFPSAWALTEMLVRYRVEGEAEAAA